MPHVHELAVIDPQASIAPDVEIGPWCVIRGRVVIEAGTRVMERVTLQGPLTLGQRNVLYPGVCLGLSPQDRKFDPTHEGAGLLVGDDNIFREGVTIHRATGAAPTTVGNRNMMMVNTHLAHDVVMGNDCTLVNGSLVAGHVQIGDRVTLGGNAGIHQFCRLGRLAMISGAIPIVQDVPPFCVCYTGRTVSSLNLVGLRRAGLRAHVAPLKQAFNLLYRQRHTTRVGLQAIERECGGDALCCELIEFVRASKRGITPYGRGREANEQGP